MDPDPDSFGSVDPDSESGFIGIKWREKQSLTNKVFGGFNYFSSLILKKVTNLQGSGTSFKINFILDI